MLYSNLNIVTASSDNAFDVEDSSIKYDLVLQNGKSKHKVVDKDGIIFYIIIEEMPELSRSIENKTYKISTERPGSWSASYFVTVNNYKFTSVGNPIATAFTGSFISKNLVINSSQMVTYYLKRKIAVAITDIYIRTEIVKKNLIVTVNRRKGEFLLEFSFLCL